MMTSHIINTLQDSGEYETFCVRYNDSFTTHLNSDTQQIPIPFHSKTRSIFMPGKFQLQTRYLRGLFRSLASDVIIIAQGYAESGVRGLMAGRHCKAPLYSYIPFGYTNAEMKNSHAWLRDLACRYIYRLADGYITLSDFQTSMLQRFTSEKQNVHVITNPIEFDYPVTDRDALLSEGDTINIAVVGRIVFKQKNQDVLIEVAKQLRDKLENFMIHVIGDGADRKELETMVSSSGIDDVITLHGWMDKKDLPSYLTDSIDIMLIPSHYEGLPLILLESVYLKKPFLISHLGFTSDYPIPESYLVDQNNPDDICRKLISLVQGFDPAEYEKLRGYILEQHSMPTFTRNVMETFNSILN